MMLDEENNKIKGKKGMVFCLHSSPKRLKLDNLNSSTLVQNESKSINSNQPSIIQPNMRFKARSDLERIIDSVNKSNLENIDNKKILKNHLKSLESLTQLKNENSLKNRKPSNDDTRPIFNLLPSKSTLDQKFLKKNKIDNSMAREVLKDLHHKTHFKAASDYALKSRIIKDKILHEKNEELNLNHNEEIINEDFDIKYYDENLAKICLFNPYNQKIKNENNSKVPVETLRYLKRISSEPFLQNPTVNENKKFVKFNKSIERARFSLRYPDESDHKKFDEEKIKISNKFYSKKDLKEISKAVLTKINYFHEKHENNNQVHYKNQGKMMITSGLPVKEFLSRTHLAFEDLKKIQKNQGSYDNVAPKVKTFLD